MEPGDQVTVGAYTVRFVGVKDAMGPNYRAAVGDVELIQDGKVQRMLHPEKRAYFSSQMPMTEAAIDTGFTRDVYVSLGEQLDDPNSAVKSGAWSVRVHYKPFVDWIWAGCLLMAFGGLIAASDRRYRIASRAASVPGDLQGAKA
jgi:cytochrome c-type biogenesis protein CcmF